MERAIREQMRERGDGNRGQKRVTGRETAAEKSMRAAVWLPNSRGKELMQERTSCEEGASDRSPVVRGVAGRREDERRGGEKVGTKALQSIS